MGQASGRVDEQHQVGIGLDHFGQPPLVFLGLHPRGDVARHADHLDHCAGIGFANGPAGGLEPQVVARAMADAVGHGVVTVLLQGLAGALQQLLLVLLVKQRLHQGPAQLLGPVAEQGPAGRRGVEKAPLRGMPGDQVGGVLGDQPV
ncbi:hypothetical protein D3C85_666570 [compost metagenome]